MWCRRRVRIRGVPPVTEASRVCVQAQPMWRLRLGAEAPRYLLGLAALFGIVASARFAILPPKAVLLSHRVGVVSRPGLSAEGYALLFARDYLTWDASQPQGSVRALEAMTGAGMEPDAGRQIPASGEQSVEWAQVVQEREAAPSEEVYTVAAQTDTAGLVFLTVAMQRTQQGQVVLASYPAFVGAPALGSAQLAEGVRNVSDTSLRTVVERAVRNYVADAPSELAADLTPAAHVSLPAAGMALVAVQRIAWMADARSVMAVVQAQDRRGAQYTLAYELDVVEAQGRWEVSAVQVNPYS